MAKLLIPLANGFEEIEAVTIIDVNRRAGNEVVVCSIESTLEVLGANGITIKADTFIDTLTTNSFDMMVLPGGGAGTQALSEHTTVQAFLKEFKSNDKLIGAICAAPYALHTAGVLNEKYTCYPSFEKQIGETGYDPTQAVVIDKDVMTSRGPGTALTFALAIVKKLNGEATYNQLVEGMIVN